ncbi:MAG: PLDc N-terminal domain-containing protein [Verrucomicrobia bacterium]|nr:PLDc N-terminal domain-containing protein [Verrucomicrobiota bacterium]
MKEFLARFSFDTLKLNAQTYACAIVIYLVVIGCALHSINSQPFSRTQRMMWITIVVAVPVLGLAAYAMAAVLYATSEASLLTRKK